MLMLMLMLMLMMMLIVGAVIDVKLDVYVDIDIGVDIDVCVPGEVAEKEHCRNLIDPHHHVLSQRAADVQVRKIYKLS